LRLDWQIWFSAMATVDEHPWTAHFVFKLLQADRGTLSLLERDPFDGGRPRFVRAELYLYEFSRPGDASSSYWKRTRLSEWLPPLSADDPRLLHFLAQRGWVEALPSANAEPHH
jgi:hypothetical protein